MAKIFHASFGELVLARGRDRVSGERLPASLAAFQLREIAADARARRLLLGACEALVGRGGMDMPHVIARLERALETGELVATRLERRRVIIPLADGPAPLGWEEAPPAPDDFLRVVVFDSAGYPMPSRMRPAPLTFDAQLAGRGPLKGLPIAGGVGRIDMIAPGTPTACTLSLHGLDADDFVPRDADADAPPRMDLVDRDQLRTPVLETKLVTRRELAAAAQRAVLDASNVFQLRRRSAEIVELEHFHDGSALLLPGEAPASVYRDGVQAPPTGIDVLRSCLTLAKDYRIDAILIAGHDARLSQHRADAVRALLVADRDTWVRIADRHHAPLRDQDAVVRFFTTLFAWTPAVMPPSATDDQRSTLELQQFQRNYNRDLDAQLFSNVPDAPRPRVPEGGIIGLRTWGALFDCYMRALRPVAAPAPASALPYIDVRKPKSFVPHVVAHDATGDDARYVEMNEYNPTKPIPGDAGWYPTYPGERVMLPPAWDAFVEKLVAAGWDAHHAPRATPRPQPQEPVPALAAPGPRAVGCGAHHLTTPYAEAEGRRAIARHVDVVFLETSDPPVVVDCETGEGPCTAAKCELYDPREWTLSYDENGARSELHEVEVLLFDSTGAPIPSPLEPLSAGVIAHLSDGRRAPATGPARIAGGAGQIGAIRGHTAHECTVTFTGLFDASVVTASPDAPPVAAPDPSVLSRLTRGKPPKEVRVVSRHELANGVAAAVDATTAFQLERRRAPVISVDDFTANGAVLLPRIPLLREILKVVGSKHSVVTGHGAMLGAQRADNVALLLRGDRARWSRMCSEVSTPDDTRAVRDWARRTAGHRLPDRDPWEPSVWRDVFDLYAHALAEPPWGSPRSYSVAISGPLGRLSLRQISELTWGYFGRIEELEKANPGIVAGPWQWADPLEGDTFALPLGWPPDGLRLHGYLVRPIPPQQRPTPRWLPHVRGGIWCGTRHEARPSPQPPRRVEVVVIDPPALVCRGDDHSKATCEVYDPSQVELAYHRILPARTLIISVPSTHVTPAGARISLLVADSDGRRLTVHRPDADGPGEGGRTFVLDRDALPNPTWLFVVGELGAFPLGSPFDPQALPSGELPPDFHRQPAPRESAAAAAG